MNKQVFNWCFIGTGTLAKQVVEEITLSGRHRVATVYSRRSEAAARFAQKYGSKAYEEAAQAILNADAVYVVTPHPSHYQYVKQAVELGKPVLCEKPFTVSGAETKELFDLARAKKVYIVEGMWSWFAPAALKVKEWLDSGEAGEVEQVITKYLVNVLDYAPRLTDPALAGGAILDSGVYPITYLYRLFGKPAGIRCSGVIENGIDLSDEIDLTFANGQTHHISLSIGDDRGEEYIRIIGTKADIFTDHFHYADKTELIAKDGNVIRTFEAKTTLLNEFDRTAEEIRAGLTESAWIPPQATIDVMEIMDECRRQIGLVYPFEKESSARVGAAGETGAD